MRIRVPVFLFVNGEVFKAFLSRREVSFRLVIGTFIKYQMLIFLVDKEIAYLTSRVIYWGILPTGNLIYRNAVYIITRIVHTSWPEKLNFSKQVKISYKSKQRLRLRMVREEGFSLKFNFIECRIVNSWVRRLPLLKQSRNIELKVTLNQSFKQQNYGLKRNEKGTWKKIRSVTYTC